MLTSLLRLSSVCYQDVRDEFGNKIKLILNEKRSSIGLEFTIISLVKNPKILRLGWLNVSNIENIKEGFEIKIIFI